MSTMRTFMRPVSGSMIDAKGMGLKRPSWIDTSAAVPPSMM
jgi:hypothetical protein